MRFLSPAHWAVRTEQRNVHFYVLGQDGVAAANKGSIVESSGGISIGNIAIWFGVVATILGIGMGAIAAAYFWPTGKSVVFQSASAPTPALDDAARQRFQQGCEALQSGNYRRAIQAFSDVLNRDRNCAEAFHNLGLTFANLGDDQAALRNLLIASDLYDQQGDKTALDRLMQDLTTLRQQRQRVAGEVESD